MKPAVATTLIAAAILAGCGGGKQSTSTSPPPSQPAQPSSPTAPQQQPTATTNTPPKKHRKKPRPLTNTSGASTQPLHVTASYKCRGKPLRALAANGPVTVKPAIVKAGQSFTVTVTDPHVKVAVVTLAGVAPKPIQVNAKPQHGHIAATIKMPSYATCGNKLLEIEGDLSAEAYVGVGS